MKALLNEKYNSMLNYLAQIKETKPHLFRIKTAVSAYKVNKALESTIENALKKCRNDI